MILNVDIYWKILDYTFEKISFLEDCIPSEVINIDTTTEDKCVWLNELAEKFKSENCTKESILSCIHIMLMRDIIKVIYSAQRKDYRIIDMTSKGYDEFIKHKGIL